MALAPSRPPQVERGEAGRLPASLALALLAALLGAVVARGGLAPYALIGLAALAIGAIVASRHVFRVLWLWVAVEGAAYPFLRYPLYHDVATFDRFVILSLGGAILLTGSRALAPDARRLAIAFGLFTAAYGLRAAFTQRLPVPAGYPQIGALTPVVDWLDHVLLPFIVFVAAARTISTADRWRAVAQALVALGVTIGALGLLEWTTGLSLAEFSGLPPFVDAAAGVVRIAGPYANPSVYGGVLLICLAATFYWMEASRQLVVGGAAAAIQLVALGPIYTKTVWGAGFVVVVMMVGLRRRTSTRTVLVLVYGLIVVGVLYALTRSSPVIAARVGGSSANVYARVGDYAEGFSIFRHWPLFGAGVEQFVPAQSIVAPAYFQGIRAAGSAHDTFISVLGEAGLFGLLPLVFLVYAIAKVLRACRRLARTAEEVLFGVAALAAAASYLLLSLTFAEIYSSPVATFLAVVLGAAAGRLPTIGTSERAAPPPLFASATVAA
jgi:O-antigen ligase